MDSSRLLVDPHHIKTAKFRSQIRTQIPNYRWLQTVLKKWCSFIINGFWKFLTECEDLQVMRMAGTTPNSTEHINVSTQDAHAEWQFIPKIDRKVTLGIGYRTFRLRIWQLIHYMVWQKYLWITQFETSIKVTVYKSKQSTKPLGRYH